MALTERRKAEAALLVAHGQLEQRVAERTAELAQANQQLTDLAFKQNLQQPAPTDTPSSISKLTERELDVLRGIVRGFYNQGIAEALHIERSTVRSHI